MTTTEKRETFNRWGTRVTITAFCGKHQPKWAGVPLSLVRVTLHDPDGDREDYQFATNLRADGGYETIAQAMEAAPEMVLKGPELKAALKQAE